MHIHTYRCHLYAIASTTLTLDSTKSKNKTKRQNVIPSVSNPKISPSIHFKRQVPQTVDLQNTFLFAQYLIKFYPTNTTFTAFLVSCSPTMTANTTLHLLLFTRVLLSKNDSKHNTTFTAFFPVSCSPTMTANTTLHLLLFTRVLLSNNDSKHQHCIYLYYFQAFVPQRTFVPSQVILTSCIHNTALNIAFTILHS